MLNPCTFDEYSPSVKSVTVRNPGAAVLRTRICADACVASTIVSDVTATPLPKSAVVAPSSQCVDCPTSETFRTCPCAATLGETVRIDEIPGITLKPEPAATSSPAPVPVMTMTVFGP